MNELSVLSNIVDRILLPGLLSMRRCHPRTKCTLILFLTFALFSNKMVNTNTLKLLNRNLKSSFTNKTAACSSAREFSCSSASSSNFGASTCIKLSQVCDGVANCADKSDEKNCDWCNRTIFINNNYNKNEPALHRLLIKTPLLKDKTQQSFPNNVLNCYYRIVNNKPNTIVGVHFRKFAIGILNQTTKTCENSWLEVHESGGEQFSTRDPVGKAQNRTQNGRFCGTLHNFWTSFYTSKKILTLNYTKIDFKLLNASSKKHSFPPADSFEFEVLFYDQDALNPFTFSKHKYQTSKNDGLSLSRFNQGSKLDDETRNSCDKQFTECTGSHYDACLIRSPGYPGIYLKNSSCSFTFHFDNQKNNRNDQKLIILNDNLQVDGHLCHYEPKMAGQMASSYFCDAGPRVSNACSDFVQIKNSNDDLVLSKSCGMGRLPKIVVSNARLNALRIEFSSANQGYILNHGFLFYAMNAKKYFENFDLFNQYKKHEIRNSFELNSLKFVEQSQIENCDHDSSVCTISIDENSLNKIYSSKFNEQGKMKKRALMDLEIINEQELIESNLNDYFKIGYLYGTNMYFSNNQTKLKYTLKASTFNTIVVYVEEFRPHLTSSSKLLSENPACLHNYLSIETRDSKSALGYDDEFDDYDFKNADADPLAHENKTKTSSLFAKYKTYRSINQNNGHNGRSILNKICSQNELNQTQTIRSFLIKASDNFHSGNSKALESKTNVVINYFVHSSPENSSDLLLAPAFNRLFDLKLSYEFLNFDWHAYEEESVCDFVYDFNSQGQDRPLSGELKNPQASIFYRTSDDSALKCKYTIISKPNQYIKLTIEQIDFNQTNCENVYFTQNLASLNSKKCDNLSKKLLISDAKLAQSSMMNDFHDNYDLKLCLCAANSNFKHVFVSKYDSVQIQYETRLNDGEQLKNENYGAQKLKLGQNFLIKYEILDRNCEKFHFYNLKSNFKGKLVYSRASGALLTHGIQSDINAFLNQTRNANNEEFRRLSEILRENLNFYCNFYLRAPRNHFIHLEIAQLSLDTYSDSKTSVASSCDRNHLKLYSNFSQFNVHSIEKFYAARPSPFVRLCPAEKNGLDKNASLHKKNVIVAEFYEESMANSSFACQNYDSTKVRNRICFLSSDLKQNKREEHFHNQIVIELQSASFSKFFFEIKYFFYRLDYSDSMLKTNSEPGVSSKSDWKKLLKNLEISHADEENGFISESYLSNSQTFLDDYDTQNCQFRCVSNRFTSESKSKICLDESLVCDGEIHCIHNDMDEANCPFKLNSKTILIALCSSFCFSLVVLLVFYVYRAASHSTKKTSDAKMDASGRNNNNHIKYARASQIEPSDIETR